MASSRSLIEHFLGAYALCCVVFASRYKPDTIRIESELINLTSVAAAIFERFRVRCSGGS